MASPMHRRSKGIAIPLQLRQSPEQDDLHPLIKQQQKMNRVSLRYAQIAGGPVPTDEELEADLRKRIDLVEKEYGHSIHRRDSKIPLMSIFNDLAYVINITIGTPPRVFRVVADTGSSDLYVPASDCKGDDGKSCNHTTLGSDSSSTFRSSGEAFSIVFETAHVSGVKVTDNVVVGDLSLNGHAFGVVDNEDQTFTNEPLYDGFLGLGQAGLSYQNNPSFLQSLKAAKLIDSAIIGIKIPRATDNLTDGEVMLGGVNSEKFDSFTMVTLNNAFTDHTYWGVTVDEVLVNGASVSEFQPGTRVIVDTGYPFLLMPLSDAAAIQRQINGSQLTSDNSSLLVPCDMGDVVSLSFASKVFPIKPQDIVKGSVSPGMCASDIVIGDPWVLGDVFLKNVYLSLDEDNDVIGFAQLTV